MRIIMQGGAGAAWRMADLAANTQDRRAPHKQMRMHAHEITSAMFRFQGNDDVNWKDLTYRYARHKARLLGRPGLWSSLMVSGILALTGRLKQSLEYPGAPGGISYSDKDKAVVGTKVPYAVYHQSEKPRTVIPRRPFFHFTGKDVDKMKAIFFKWVHKQVHKKVKAPTQTQAGWPRA